MNSGADYHLAYYLSQ